MKAKARGRAAVRALPLACLLVLAAGSARAEHHMYEGRTIDRSPAEAFPGAVIQVWGTGCIEGGQPYERAAVWMGNPTFDTPNRYYPIRSDGSWGGEFTVPSEAPPGDYRLGADCSADDMVFPVGYQDFRVLDPSPPMSTTTTTTATTTTTSSASPPTTRSATSKPASSSTPPSTDPAPTGPPPSEPVSEPLPSVPVAAAEPPEKPSDEGGSFPFVPAAAAVFAAGGAGAAWQLRRRRTANEP